MVLTVNACGVLHVPPTDGSCASDLSSETGSVHRIGGNWCNGLLTGIHHLCWNPETGLHESTSVADPTHLPGRSQQWQWWRPSRHTQHSSPCRAAQPCPSAHWTWPSKYPHCNGSLQWSPSLYCLPHDTSQQSVHGSFVWSL
jgi:hypothetical protein